MGPRQLPSHQGPSCKFLSKQKSWWLGDLNPCPLSLPQMPLQKDAVLSSAHHLQVTGGFCSVAVQPAPALAGVPSPTLSLGVSTPRNKVGTQTAFMHLWSLKEKRKAMFPSTQLSQACVPGQHRNTPAMSPYSNPALGAFCLLPIWYHSCVPPFFCPRFPLPPGGYSFVGFPSEGGVAPMWTQFFLAYLALGCYWAVLQPAGSHMDPQADQTLLFTGL